MSGLETAIRNALERAERANPIVRARIYQSARNALETGIRKQEITDAALILTQQRGLEETIRVIESEEEERLRSMAQPGESEGASERADLPEPAAPEVRPDPQQNLPDNLAGLRQDQAHVHPRAHAQETSVLADLVAGERHHPPTAQEEEDPAWAAPSTPAAARVTKASKGSIRRAGPTLIALFVYGVILGFVGYGGWWVYSTGLLQTLAARQNNVARVTPPSQAGDFSPSASPLDPQRGFTGDWIDIYRPGESKIVAHGAAKVSEMTDSDGKAALILSSKPDADGEVEVEVPADILAGLAQKSVVFAITAKADGDRPVQIYIECDFSGLGNCARHRYQLTPDRSDQLFKMDFKGKPAPTGKGHIIINSDVSGAAAGIRLYGIRVLPDE